MTSPKNPIPAEVLKQVKDLLSQIAYLDETGSPAQKTAQEALALLASVKESPATDAGNNGDTIRQDALRRVQPKVEEVNPNKIIEIVTNKLSASFPGIEYTMLYVLRTLKDNGLKIVRGDGE